MKDFYNSNDINDIMNTFTDGFLFERFSQEFLTARLGYEFLSGDCFRDRGIDGIIYLSNNDKDLFQISIDKDPKGKIKHTYETLKKNEINFSRLTYVTNQKVREKDILIDSYMNDFNINLRIFDVNWISLQVEHSNATKSVLKMFVDNHLRQFQKPGECFVLNDYVKNPKLYVFLRQQISCDSDIKDLNKNLVDSLILFSLRNTDPDRDQFMTTNQILETVKELIDFEIMHLKVNIRQRLKILSRKPTRKINFHSNIDSYCLPYEKRKNIIMNNIKDKELYDKFFIEAERVLRKNLLVNSVNVKDVADLLKKTLEKIYYRQGLEFSNFLLYGGSEDAIATSLKDTVDDILDESAIVGTNKTKVKDALIFSIRDIIYHGTPESKEYLCALAKTYQMLFLLRCDSKIVEYFQTMAGALTLFVCTSILVPAFSEIYLESQNQRYWSLLKAAKLKGVKLKVNDTIISELDFHLKRSLRIFNEDYAEGIDLFKDGSEYLINEILIRAFAYAKREGRVNSYYKFLENFISINQTNTRQELIDFLYEEFGIEYVSDSKLDVNIDKKDYRLLEDRLSQFKNSPEQAKTDAKLILTIYALRDKNNESQSSLDGHKTWVLSSDTITQRTVSDLFKNKYPITCYMRPDFLHYFISFTPSRESVAEVYKKTFPNLLGIQISNHLPDRVSATIREIIIEHGQKPNGRIKAQIRNLIDELKSNPNLEYKDKLKSFFNSVEYENKRNI